MSFIHSTLALKIGFAFTTFTTICLLASTLRSSSGQYALEKQGTINHIVMFKYGPNVSVRTKQNVTSSFLALKDSCKLPDGTRYIVSIDGGLNISPEKKGQGMEHVYVVTFRSIVERDFYLERDSAHQTFMMSVKDKVSDALVFDFACGDFVRQESMRRTRRPSDEIHVRTV